MNDDPDLFLGIMDRVGIDLACLNCIFREDARQENDLAADFVKRWPKRFIGVAFVTPLDPDETVPELERCFDQLGMKSIKKYPHYSRIAHDDVVYFPIYEFATDRRLAVMSYAWNYFD